MEFEIVSGRVAVQKEGKNHSQSGSRHQKQRPGEEGFTCKASLLLPNDEKPPFREPTEVWKNCRRFYRKLTQLKPSCGNGQLDSRYSRWNKPGATGVGTRDGVPAPHAFVLDWILEISQARPAEHYSAASDSEPRCCRNSCRNSS